MLNFLCTKVAEGPLDCFLKIFVSKKNFQVGQIGQNVQVALLALVWEIFELALVHPMKKVIRYVCWKFEKNWMVKFFLKWGAQQGSTSYHSVFSKIGISPIGNKMYLLPNFQKHSSNGLGDKLTIHYLNHIQRIKKKSLARARLFSHPYGPSL